MAACVAVPGTLGHWPADLRLLGLKDGTAFVRMWSCWLAVAVPEESGLQRSSVNASGRQPRPEEVKHAHSMVSKARARQWRHKTAEEHELLLTNLTLI